MNLPNNKTNKCTLLGVLLVPELAFNLFSVTSAYKKGKLTTFSDMKCETRGVNSQLVATGYRDGSLYYLDHKELSHQACSSLGQSGSKSKLTIWHQRFGHLGAGGLRELAKTKMVNGLQYDWK